MASESQEPPARTPNSPLRASWDTFCARGILAAVLAILIWGPLAFGAVRIGSGTEENPHLYAFLVIEGLTFAGLGLWVARLLLQRPFRLLWPPVCWAALGFAVYAIIRCHFVEIAYAARLELEAVILYTALFFLVINNLNRRDSVTIVSLSLIALAFGESVFAIYQCGTHHAGIWNVVKPEMYLNRGSGTFINPNNFAGFVEMILPIALAYTVMGRFSAVQKVLLGYSVLVMLVAVVASGSRGGIAGTGVSLVVFSVFLVFQRNYWKRGLVALGVLAVAGGVFAMQFDRITTRLERGFFDKGDGRVFYWNAAEEIFHQHLIWGAGPGHFNNEYPTRLTSPYGQASPKNAHNDYLNTLCEWGLVGLAIILSAVGFVFIGVCRCWPYLRRGDNEIGKSNSTKAAFVLGASLGLLAILVHSVVDFNMQIPANAILAITLMALLTVHWRFGTERYWVNPGKTGKLLLAAAAAGVIGYLGFEGVKEARELAWIERAMGETGSWDRKIADLKTAVEIEPDNFMTRYQLGECCRLDAWQGNRDNEALANEGIKWFESAFKLNPYDAASLLGIGLCLDWLDQPILATPYFTRANELEPYNSVILMYLGYHALDMGDYSLATRWLQWSLAFHPSTDAAAYLETVQERMGEAEKLKKGTGK